MVRAAHLLPGDHGVLDARIQSALRLPVHIASTGKVFDLARNLSAVIADIEALEHRNSTPGRADCRVRP